MRPNVRSDHMPDETYKTHVKIVVTRKMLKSLFACDNGIADVARFLPATLHTDPEKNLPLARKLADSDVAHQGRDRAWWLAYHTTNEGTAGLLPDLQDGLIVTPDAGQCPSYYTQLDAFIIAQWLAWAADAIATKAGR